MGVEMNRNHEEKTITQTQTTLRKNNVYMPLNDLFNHVCLGIFHYLFNVLIIFRAGPGHFKNHSNMSEHVANYIHQNARTKSRTIYNHTIVQETPRKIKAFDKCRSPAEASSIKPQKENNMKRSLKNTESYIPKTFIYK